jgi:hypothetical protein
LRIFKNDLLRNIFFKSKNDLLRGFSTVFEILDRGSEEKETSYRNFENPEMKIYPFAPDQK